MSRASASTATAGDRLVLSGLSSFYGASQILHGVDLDLGPGEVVCLLGLNGMGKTTTLRSVMGLVDRTEGSIRLGTRAVDGPTHRRARLGITLVPEDRRVFASLSVRENLDVAASASTTRDGFRRDDVVALFPRLAERLEQAAGTMSGGEQQMLSVARALVMNPRMLMLDEPTEGLAPSYVEAIRDAIVAARTRGMGVLLVEQSWALALAVGDRFLVMENGRIVHDERRDAPTFSATRIEAMLTIR